jgi:hypothetical protein
MRITEQDRDVTLARFKTTVESCDVDTLEQLRSKLHKKLLLGDYMTTERALAYLKQRITQLRQAEQPPTREPDADDLARLHGVSRTVAQHYIKRQKIRQASDAEPRLDERSEAQKQREQITQWYETGGNNGNAE